MQLAKLLILIKYMVLAYGYDNNLSQYQYYPLILLL